MNKEFRFEAFGEKYTARFVYSQYVKTKTPYIAVATYNKDTKELENFCDVTTCVDGLKENSDEIALPLRQPSAENSYWPQVLCKL